MSRHEGSGETDFSVHGDVACVQGRGRYLDFLNEIALGMDCLRVHIASRRAFVRTACRF